MAEIALLSNLETAFVGSFNLFNKVQTLSEVLKMHIIPIPSQSYYSHNGASKQKRVRKETLLIFLAAYPLRLPLRCPPRDDVQGSGGTDKC